MSKEPSQRDWDRQEKMVAAEGRASAWTEAGAYRWQRSDGAFAATSLPITARSWYAKGII